MSNIYSKKDYSMLRSKLMEEYAKDPKRANLEAYYALYKNGKLKYTWIDKIIGNAGAIMLLVLLILGFLNIENIILYIFGLGFFSALYLVISSGQAGSIIFIYSHGLIGFCIMNGIAISDIINSPLFSDIPNKLFYIILIAAFLLVSALIYGTVYCLSKEMQSRPINKSIPTLLAGTSAIIIQLTYHFLI